jgi:hypothetical protein
LAFVAVAGLIVAGVVIYVKTDRGIVEVQTDDDDIKIAVEKGGKVIEILDAKSGKKFRVSTGEVSFKLLTDDKDLQIKPGQAVLRRGEKQVVVVTRLNPPVGPGNEFPALDPKWIKMVQNLSIHKQLEEVKRELRRRNPDFAGDLNHTLNAAGAVTGLSIFTGEITDLTPIRVFKDLEQLDCNGVRAAGRGSLEDLRPLAGLKLKRLNLERNSVADLTPLKGMPLERLDCEVTAISDLGPLKDMTTLTYLSCHGTLVKDLTPLEGLKNLRQLDCGFTQVQDLSPLKGLALAKLHLVGCSSNLDLEPLRGMPLVVFDYAIRLDREVDIQILKSMPKLKEIRGKPASEVLGGTGK